MPDLEIIIPSEEINEVDTSELPPLTRECVENPIPKTITDFKIAIYTDPRNASITFVSPNIIAFPSTEEATEVALTRVAEDRQKLFLEHALDAKNYKLLMLFAIYHEICHILQFQNGELIPRMVHTQIKRLEKDADEFALRKIKNMIDKQLI